MKKTKTILIITTLCITLVSLNSLAQNNTSHSLMIGDTAPSFRAETTQGVMNFPDDFYGKWKIIFSHPGDFTPVCTSEMLSFAMMSNDFKKLNCELIGLSVDSRASHLEWIRSMENLDYKGQTNIHVEFPIISDRGMEVASLYSMIQPNAVSTRTIRAVYFINPENIIDAILYYPQHIGRNTEEIKRLLIALQTADRYDVETPADWQTGDDIIISSPQSQEEYDKQKRSEEKGDIKCLDWYFCFKKL